MAFSKHKHRQNLLIEALEKSLGVVTVACKSVGVSRDFFYDWYKKDEDFKKRVDDIENIALDFAESQLHNQIKKGEVTATIFYLKTKGKKRGYIERTEIEQSGSITTTVLDASKMSTEELKKLINE